MHIGKLWMDTWSLEAHGLSAPSYILLPLSFPSPFLPSFLVLVPLHLFPSTHPPRSYLSACFSLMSSFLLTLLPQICSACVRCKSCGATPGKNWDVEWSGDYSLCPRCTELYEKGGTWQENRAWGTVVEWARLWTRDSFMASSTKRKRF